MRRTTWREYEVFQAGMLALLGLMGIQASAKEGRARSQRAEEEAATRRKYHQEVEQALSTIDNSALLPPADFPEPRCTDLNGLLRRIAETVGPKPSLVAMITDGADDCSPPLKPVPPPKSDLSLVIILVPEKPKLRAVSHPKPGKMQHAQQPVPRQIEPEELGHRQFETRKKQLANAIPWAIVVPYFQEDLSQAFAEAARMRIRHMKAAREETRP